MVSRIRSAKTLGDTCRRRHPWLRAVAVIALFACVAGALPELAAGGPKQKASAKAKADAVAEKSGAALPAETAAKVKVAGKSVALIEGKSGFGTGFVVAPGILATNYHVLGHEALADCTVRFITAGDPDPKPLKIDQLLFESPRRDLVLVRVKDLPTPLNLATDPEVAKGRPVLMIGNPSQSAQLAYVANAKAGAIGEMALIHGQTYNELSIDAAPGNSGGPIFDAHSMEVIGVLTWGTHTRDEKTSRITPGGKGYCIPVQSLAKALEGVANLQDTQRLSNDLESLHSARHIALTIDEGCRRFSRILDARINLRSETHPGGNPRAFQDDLELSRGVRNWHDATSKALDPHFKRIVERGGSLPKGVVGELNTLRDNYNTMRIMHDQTKGSIQKGISGQKDLLLKNEKVVEKLLDALHVPADFRTGKE